MDRTKYLLIQSFWMFSIVAVTLLAPSSGLITLTIPDEPTGNIVVLSDSPHIGKRTSDDPKHLELIAASATLSIHPALVSTGSIAAVSLNDPYTDSASSAQIRAPPGGGLS